MKKLFVPITIAALCLNAYAEPEIKGKPAEVARYLNGVPAQTEIAVLSEKTVTADKATVHFVLTGSEDTIREAIDEVSSLQKKITRKLGDKGVSENAISGKAYSTLPEYSFYSKKPTSYTVKKTVSVSISSEEELIKTLAVFEEFSDTTRFLRLTFDFTNEEKLEAELLEENLKKIAVKKAIYEKSLEVKLRVKTFHESPVGKTTPQINTLPTLKTYLGSSITKTGSDGVQWAAADQNQKGFSEFEFSRRLVVVYSVED